MFSSELFHLFYLPARIISTLYREFRRAPDGHQPVLDPDHGLELGDDVQEKNEEPPLPNCQGHEFCLF